MIPVATRTSMSRNAPLARWIENPTARTLSVVRAGADDDPGVIDGPGARQYPKITAWQPLFPVQGGLDGADRRVRGASMRPSASFVFKGRIEGFRAAPPDVRKIRAGQRGTGAEALDAEDWLQCLRVLPTVDLR